MDQKPKTRKPPGKETKPKESQKEQSERFIETARKLGVDENGRMFDKNIRRLIRERR